MAGDTGASRWLTAVARGFTTDEAILKAIATRTRMRVAGALTSSPQAVARVPEELARRYSILPLSVSERTIDVATAIRTILTASRLWRLCPGGACACRSRFRRE
jgi:type II secretion system (T2SS) protein E